MQQNGPPVQDRDQSSVSSQAQQNGLPCKIEISLRSRVRRSKTALPCKIEISLRSEAGQDSSGSFGLGFGFTTRWASADWVFGLGFAPNADAALFPSMGPVSASSRQPGWLTCVPTSEFVITMKLDTLSPERQRVWPGQGGNKAETHMDVFRARFGEVVFTIFFGATRPSPGRRSRGGRPTVSGTIAPGLASIIVR